jgi:hypothetical protein
MKLAKGVDFIKLFLQNLRTKFHNLSQNLIRQYANSSINYTKKFFMKLAKGVDVIKHLTSVIY